MPISKVASHDHREEEARREEAAPGRGGGEPGVARQQGLRRHVGVEANGYMEKSGLRLRLNPRI